MRALADVMIFSSSPRCASRNCSCSAPRCVSTWRLPPISNVDFLAEFMGFLVELVV